MEQNQSDLDDIFLTVGEHHFTTKPSRVRTVLGSCVTVTLFDKQTRTGAMCHGLLPKCKNYGTCDKEYSVCFRFVECSIWAMLAKFEKAGIPRQRLEAKLFGGSVIMANREQAKDVFQVAQRNVDAAMTAIEEAGLKLVAFDFGGGESRRLMFRTDTGKVLLQRSGLGGGAEF